MSILMSLVLAELPAKRCPEGFARHPKPEEHEGGVGLPQEIGRFYGETQHADRETSNARIQTK